MTKEEQKEIEQQWINKMARGLNVLVSMLFKWTAMLALAYCIFAPPDPKFIRLAGGISLLYLVAKTKAIR